MGIENIDNAATKRELLMVLSVLSNTVMLLLNGVDDPKTVSIKRDNIIENIKQVQQRILDGIGK